MSRETADLLDGMTGKPNRLAFWLVIKMKKTAKDDRADRHYRLGWDAQEAGRHKEAIKHFTEALDTDPDLVDALAMRGVSFALLKKYERAIEDYDAVLQRSRDDAATYNNRAISLKNLQRRKAALRDYNKAVRLDPTDHKHFYNRAKLHEDLGDFDRAVADYEKALALSSTHEKSRDALTRLRSQI